jgi:transcriptional regulator with XRE-family HTH domain
MEAKLEERKKAVKLRKLGYSHSEILKKVKVTRSTLTAWLKNIHLTKPQIERLRLKRENGRKLGSLTLKRNRIEKTKEIIDKAKSEINSLNESHLKIIGSILYWAEGSKQKEHDPSKELVFSNSDPKMIKLYLLWLNKCLLIKPDDIVFEMYIHETYQKTKDSLATYWSKVTNFDKLHFQKVYFKKNKVHTMRKNKGKDYHGVLRISVKRSTDLNRKVTGWIQGICKEFIH